MSSNKPTYVAGLLLGVLPIGFCVIKITLSISSIPLTSLHFPGFSLVLYKFEATDLYKIYFIDLTRKNQPIECEKAYLNNAAAPIIPASLPSFAVKICVLGASL